MDDTTTTVIIEDEPATVNLDAEVTITFTVSRTYEAAPMTVASIVGAIATAAQEAGVPVNQPGDWVDMDDPTDYVYGLLDENPALRDQVLPEWAKGASIEDEEITVEEVS